MKNVKSHFWGEIHSLRGNKYYYEHIDIDAPTFERLMKQAKITVKEYLEPELKEGKKFYLRNIQRTLESKLPTYRIKTK